MDTNGYSTLLTRLIAEREMTNANTILAYAGAEQRLVSLHPATTYWTISELGMKKLMMKSNFSPSSLLQMLNLLIMIRRMELRPVASLTAYRNKLKKEIEEDTKTMLPLTELPDYEEYFGGISLATPQRYIVNSLIQHFGLRNLDMLLKIVHYKRGVPLPDVKRNFLIIQSKDVLLEIRDFKTRTTYGIKKIRISHREHPVLVRCIKQYAADGHMYLLSKRNKDEIQKTSLHSHVRILTSGHGEGKLFKTVVDYHRRNANLNQLAALSKSRGTSMQTMCSSYNPENSES